MMIKGAALFGERLFCFIDPLLLYLYTLKIKVKLNSSNAPIILLNVKMNLAEVPFLEYTVKVGNTVECDNATISIKPIVVEVTDMTGATKMIVSYKKLWKLLIDRDMMKKDLQEAASISWASVTKMSKGETVSMEVLMKVCKALNCDIGDIMELIPEEE